MSNKIEVAKGNISRILSFRLKPGMDILLSIIDVCKSNDITNGVIISAIGSLDGAKFFDPVKLPNTKAGYGYSDPITIKGPIELLSLNGMICHENNELLPHFHYSLSDSNGNAYGGHVIEGNIVLMTVDVIIGEIAGIDMIRNYDEDLGVPIYNPVQI